MTVLETARLRLRPRRRDDLAANLAMDLDPEVHRYIWSEPRDPEAYRAELRQRIESGWPPVGGIWVVERRDAPGFLGWCGLFPLEQTGLVEIGYRYVRAAWGQGIATEAGRAVLDHGFDVLGLDPIVAVVDPRNRGSDAVIRKLGLEFLGLQQHYNRLLNFYRLDWAKKSRARSPAQV